MLAQRSEKNSKRDKIGLFAEPVEGPESQSTKGRGNVGVRHSLRKKTTICLFATTVCRSSLLPSRACFGI